MFIAEGKKMQNSRLNNLVACIDYLWTVGNVRSICSHVFYDINLVFRLKKTSMLLIKSKYLRYFYPPNFILGFMLTGSFKTIEGDVIHVYDGKGNPVQYTPHLYVCFLCYY